MDITLDRTSRVPLYRQIEASIREMILTGSLPPGFRLPPERRLARALGVNRTTVLNAYRELKADGLVDAHVGRGTTVCPGGDRPRSRSMATELPWSQLFRELGPDAQDPLIRDLLELSERRDLISFSIGLPAPELIPVETFGSLLDDLLRDLGTALFLHCPTEGVTALRETLSAWLASRGLCCRPSDVLVLSGSQQGLDLAARVLLEPGDTVVVEEPTYIGALPVFRAAGARLVGVPVDDDGMRTDILSEVLQRRRPKLIYTLPTFQNPSGRVLSLERRQQLLDLALGHGVPILEDDPYGELRYEGTPLPSLRALDESGQVIYLSTFSKSLFPGLRLGFLVAPPQVIRRFALAKQGIDLHSSSLAQWLLDRYLREGLYDPHLESLRAAYSRRRDAMAHALRAPGLSDLTWTMPEGGFYFWCRLSRHLEQSRLLACAADAGVTYLPGRSCFARVPQEAYLRLNFTFPSEEMIREGVERLGRSMLTATNARTPLSAEETSTPPIV